MEIANYKEVCEKTKDEQGALIQFLIFNMTEEILGKYKNGELIRENEKNYLLLIEETEEDNQKTILKEIARVLPGYCGNILWRRSAGKSAVWDVPGQSFPTGTRNVRRMKQKNKKKIRKHRT